ncbi:hypothetical protein RvY_04870-2 [Ramazzottius varieornatus]|uniref:RING-type domain-containing protein n=1 Tax=Ramazzottius varieornatus TaxID=947166 RepID=A0A1D1V302_RAMVA|nr:hypothetical protein RvY_04870-2 [Ramazzottius varieornatus]
MTGGTSLAARFILTRDTPLAENQGALLPAGSLVQEIKNGSDKPNQLLLQSLEDHPNATGGQAFVLVPVDQLCEVSKIFAELLAAEKNHTARLVVCRDENWLEEALHIDPDSEVLVSFGQLQMLGIVHWIGALPSLRGKWFGVEIYPSELIDVTRYVQGNDGSPMFQCVAGFGVYVAVTRLRLADACLDAPFPKRAKGKKPFSVRPTKASEIVAAKNNLTSSHTNGNSGMSGQISSVFDEAMEWTDQPTSDNTPLAVNDRVVWFGGDKPARGTVVYVGKVSKKKSGVALEFDEAIGDKKFTGMNNEHCLFTVADGHGKLVELGEVVREKDYGFEEAPQVQTAKTSMSGTGSEPSSSGVPRLADRVVWYSPEGEVRGQIAYIGKVPGEEGEKLGLRLDEQKGDKRFRGEVNGKDLFHCGPGYGAIVEFDDVILEKVYDNAEGKEQGLSEVAVHDKINWLNPEDGKYEEGTVRYIGDVGKKKEDRIRMVGIEFVNPCGQLGWAGRAYKEQLFKVKQNHGMLVSLAEMTAGRNVVWFTKDEYNRQKREMATKAEEPVKMQSKQINPVVPDGKTAAPRKPAPKQVTKENDFIQAFTSMDKYEEFTVGQRVLVVSKKAGEAARLGKILWMGTIAAITGPAVLCGLEMDESVGSEENVTYCGYAGNEKRGFVEVYACKPGHGQFVSIKDVIAADVADMGGHAQSEPMSENGGWQHVGKKQGANPAHAVRLHETLTFERNQPPLHSIRHLVPSQQPSVPSHQPAWQNNSGMGFVPQNNNCSPFAVGPFRPPFSPAVQSLPMEQTGNRTWMDHSYRQQQQQQPPPRLQLRQEALTFIGNKPVKGVVVWIGQPHFAPQQLYVGLMMLQAGDGTNAGANGWVDGYHYFECLPNCGLMCLADEVHSMDLPQAQQQFSPALSPVAQAPARFGFAHQASGSPPAAYHPTRPAAPVQVAPVQRPPVQSEESVRAAIQEADRLERLENERKSHVAIFQTLASEELGGVEVTVELPGTKGFVKFCPRPKPFDGEQEFSVTTLVMPVADGNGNAGFEPRKQKRSIEYLPPVFLHFQLTEGFPEKIPPTYQVKCNWLPNDKIDVLRERLVKSWKDNVRQANKNILFEATRVLRCDLLSIAGLEFGIVYYSQALADFVGILEIEPIAGRCLYATDKEVQDTVNRIVKFDEKTRKEALEKDLVECPICASSYAPAEVNIFSTTCSHMFCVGCVTQHVKTQVEGNNWDKIPCMHDGCEITAPLHELSDLVEPIIFEQLNRTKGTAGARVRERYAGREAGS